MFRRLNCLLTLSFLTALLFASDPVFAQDAPVTDESQLDHLLPRKVNLDEILSRIETEPDNLDHYYAYGQAAEKQKQYADAAWAYREMLKRNSNLDRVRLDLSLVYISLGHFVEACQLMDEVLSHNPPPEVQRNIKLVRDKVGALSKRHAFGGSISTGINFDSNANVLPSSGNITVLDTIIPLGGGLENDLHGFVAANIGHTYQHERIADNVALRWKSSGLAYTTEQQQLDHLNIDLFSLRTGPEIYYAPMGMRMEIAGVYNFLVLDGYAYLRNPRAEFLVDLPLDERTTLLLGHVREYREFINSPTVTIYNDRSGNAWQHQFGLRYIHSPKSMWEGQFILRREDARALYYANHQDMLSLSHTYLFEDGFFTQLRGSRKFSRYDEADPLISLTVRDDDELSSQLSGGYKFPEWNLTLSGSYTYTRVYSNILNYQYINHRLGVMATKNF